jgi:hypothetical protein
VSKECKRSVKKCKKYINDADVLLEFIKVLECLCLFEEGLPLEKSTSGQEPSLRKKLQ